MCGIAGEVNWSGGSDILAATRMAMGIAHRGPDDHGLWVEEERRCVLVHRRLSIIDLSPLGHQPMIDPLTGNSLVFNGEIYNYQELRRQCEAGGDKFRSESDTEVVLALYRRYGEACLGRLRGMFAIALWDAKRRQLFLARDRLGKKPLNYAETETGIVFCSELKPLAQHPSVGNEMDEDALDLYLQLQSIPAPWTIYRGIKKLPPAHFAVASQDGMRMQRYWDLDYRRKSLLSENEALDAFEEKLTEAIRLRMICDVPLGALLSGGVDSSVVVALMSKLSSVPVRTFSIGFGAQSFDESPYAQLVADTCGTLHNREVVDGNVEAMLPLLARCYGEPYADSSAIPSFHVSQVARKHVSVVLNGDGGDELLGGYDRYAVPSHAMRTGAMLSWLIGPEGLTRMVPFWANSRTFTRRALRRVARDFLSPEMGGLLMFSGYWNDDLRRELLVRDRSRSDLIQRWRLHWLRQAFNRADNPIDRMLWLDSHTALPDDLLVKMDIATMHCGLEARSPFLDHELMEFCASLPVDLKVRDRTGKYLLKRLAERYFPRDFVHRRKMGFGIPVAEWLRTVLKRHTEEIIHDRDLMQPLDMATIRKSWKRLMSATGADLDAEAGRIWALLMFGHWKLQEH